MTESELKAAFAAFLLDNPAQPLGAALKLYPSEKDRGEACRIAFSWPNDPEVIIELERLKTVVVPNKDIPTKEQFIAEMWKLAKSENVSPKDRAAAGRLVGDVMGFVKTPSADEGLGKRMPMQPVYKIVQA